jgi:hypothetical protein
MKTPILAAALAAAAVSLAGCRDSTGSDGAYAGSMAFSFAGARSGTFSARGTIHRRGEINFVKRPFAAGYKYVDVDPASPFAELIEVMAYAPVTESRGTWVFFLLPPVTAGQTLDLSCDVYTAFCIPGHVVFDADPNLALDDDRDGFSFRAGTVTITSISGGRLRATFSATAQGFYDPRTITVTGGSFDVPLLDQSHYYGDRVAPGAAFLRRHD